MTVFIDTNIFLSFYYFSSDDLEELKKLIVLLDDKSLVLVSTNQVIDEFYRNRENKIYEALKKLKEQHLNLEFPNICKDYDEYEEMREVRKIYEDKHNLLITNIKGDIERKTLKADKIILSLFEKSQVLNSNAAILNRARERVEIGNPPGKNGSFGDAINWELLLENIPDQTDLNLISDDKDYYSVLDDSRINDFLYSEWYLKKKSNIIYYKKLSGYFSDNYPTIRLASEFEKELLIKKLSKSGTFDSTHRIVAKLNVYDDFNDDQIDEIIKTSYLNNQITMILNDDDIKEFIKPLLRRRKAVTTNEHIEYLEDEFKKYEK